MIAKKSCPSRLTPARTIWGPLLAVLIAIAPKCPLCWAAYLSLLGISSASLISMGPLITPALLLLLAINLFAIGRRAVLRNLYLPLILSCAGFLALAGFIFLDLSILRLPGFLLILAGSLFNALPAQSPEAPCQCHLR